MLRCVSRQRPHPPPEADASGSAGGLCSQLLAALLGPGVRKELPNAALRPAPGDAGEDVAQVEARVNASRTAGAEEADCEGKAPGAVVRAGEEPVGAANGNGADGALERPIVQGHPAVVEDAVEGGPLADGIGKGPSKPGGGRSVGVLAGDPPAELVEERPGEVLATACALLRGDALQGGRGFDGVHLRNEGEGHGGPRVVGLQRALEIAAGVHPAPEAEESAPLALELAWERPVAVPLEVAAARGETAALTRPRRSGFLRISVTSNRRRVAFFEVPVGTAYSRAQGTVVAVGSSR